MDAKRLTLFLFILSCPATHTVVAQVAENTGIWDVVERTQTASPSANSLEALFGSKIQSRFDNGYWNYSEGTGQRLRDGVEVTEFGLMTKMDSSLLPRL